jgi:hypothetical protein
MDESKLTFGAYWRAGVIVSIGWLIWAAMQRSSMLALLLLPLLAVLWFFAIEVMDRWQRNVRDEGRSHRGSSWPTRDSQMQQRTAKELADMIATRLRVRDVHVMVHQDPVQGWHPTVVTGLPQVIACQQRAEQIAAKLRTEFELKA